ncbi:MAG TPA: phosphomannomutase, partial [Desulfobulbaceae bacterium]|nr:phosphomannomutase [Desulfobulbaceae bacterium]
MPTPYSCFTAYDVRGRVPDELNETIGARIGCSFAEQFDAKKLVIGHDMRLSSPPLVQSMIRALTAQGVDVEDIGLCGTEEMYYAVFNGEDQGIDGGIMVTASHNPADYNGMKLVQKGARPVSGDSGLDEIGARAADDGWWHTLQKHKPGSPGTYRQNFDKSSYIHHLLSQVDASELQPLTLVVNGGNGCAGPIIDLLEEHLPFTFIRINHEPDGTFPNGIPNPLLPEKREATAAAVRKHGADLGIAWDGDFDRCFLYDENGRFIEGYYIVGLLGVAILKIHPGATILHDPRLIWNTREMVTQAGGKPVMTKTGHAFIKEKMRETDAVYGGEMSAHHYFRDFGYCDTGMLPWLLVCRLMSIQNSPLSAMVDDRMAAYPVSGEINSRVKDPDAVIQTVEQQYKDGKKDYTDGLSVEFPLYRFNLRKSNTEPVLRLNVETRADPQL